MKFDNAKCFLEYLEPQNVIIMFLFSMKYLYRLMAKITPDVNNSLKFLHGVKELLWPESNAAIFCILDATFGV